MTLTPDQTRDLIALLTDLQSVCATNAQRLDRIEKRCPEAVAMFLHYGGLCADTVAQLRNR